MATIVDRHHQPAPHERLICSMPSALGATAEIRMVPKNIAIGIGMWLGAIAWFNVWFP